MSPYSDKARDPVRALLTAYAQADQLGAAAYDTYHQQAAPCFLCWNAARNAFRRHFKRQA